MNKAAIRALPVLWYGGLIAGGFALVWTASPWGIGIRHDSLSYLTSAQSLGRVGCLCRVGSGLELKPLVHFGPVYPALLWAVTLLSGNLLVGARWITALLYGVNLTAWSSLVHLHTRRFWAGAVVAGMLAASPLLLQVHDAAMSEPVFLAILPLGLATLTAYLTGKGTRFLWMAGGAVAVMVLTRYAAGAVAGLGLLAVLVLRRASWRDRLQDGARFSVAVVVPVGAWLVRNALVAGSATNRSLRWHPITVDDLRTFLQTISAWFTPRQVSHWVEGALWLGLLLAVGVFLWRRRSAMTGGENPAVILGLVLVGLTVIYPVFVAVSRSVFDESIPIDDRMFSPLFMAAAALIGITAAEVGKVRVGPWLLAAFGILFLVEYVPYNVGRYRARYEHMRQDGVLFASPAWQQSGSLAWVRNLPQDALVYSNQAIITQFLVGRPVYSIPEKVDTVKGEPRPDFEEELNRMYGDLERRSGYLLIFDPAKPMSPDDLEDEYRIGLKVILSTADGFVMIPAASGGVR